MEEVRVFEIWLARAGVDIFIGKSEHQ